MRPNCVFCIGEAEYLLTLACEIPGHEANHPRLFTCWACREVLIHFHGGNEMRVLTSRLHPGALTKRHVKEAMKAVKEILKDAASNRRA